MDISDFARQVPLQILLAPIFFGTLYIALMVYIVQRARKRRKRQQEAAMAMAPLKFDSSGTLIPQQGKDEEQTFLAASTIPADLPEPELDLLAMPLRVKPDVAAITVVQPEETPIGYEAMLQPVGPYSLLEPEATPADPIASDTVETDGKVDSTSMETELTSLPSDAVEVMRIYRDLNDGRLIVQMGDQFFRTANEVKSPDLARRFTTVIRELWAMINTTPARATSAMTSAAPSTDMPVSDGYSVGTKPRMGLMTDDQEPSKLSMFKAITKSVMGQPTSIPSGADSPAGIVGVVEDFLQFKLASTPQFSSRSIHFRPTYDHSIRIEVDGHFYEAIGDVVDPDVREFLFALMREWEARH